MINLRSLIHKKNAFYENSTHIQVYATLQSEQGIPPADLPDLDTMREKLRGQDFSKFPQYDRAAVAKVDKMLAEDIPRLMGLLPAEDAEKARAGLATITGGVFDKVNLQLNAKLYLRLVCRL